jgi:hypothetical protein
VDQNLTNEYNNANLLLLNHAYNHTPNALVLLLSTVVGDINNNEQRPAGRDGPEGGAPRPPNMVAIVVVVVVDDGSGGVGAND